MTAASPTRLRDSMSENGYRSSGLIGILTLAGLLAALLVVVLVGTFVWIFSSKPPLPTSAELVTTAAGPLALAVVTIGLLMVNRRLGKIQAFQVSPDLQPRSIEWRESDDSSIDVRLRFANVGGHRTAIESIRIVDQDGDAEADYMIQARGKRVYNHPSQANRIVEPGAFVEVIVGKAELDGRRARRDDFDNPVIEVVPVMGELDPNGFMERPESP